VVENTGGVPLDGVVVNDDQLGPVNCPQSTLAVGESITCFALGFATDTTGLPGGVYANIGTVVAQSPTGPGPDGRTTVSDTDLSHYDNTP
jgi:hypothetical protein